MPALHIPVTTPVMGDEVSLVNVNDESLMLYGTIQQMMVELILLNSWWSMIPHQP